MRYLERPHIPAQARFALTGTGLRPAVRRPAVDTRKNRSQAMPAVMGR